MIPFKETKDGVVFHVRVLPRSSRCEVAGIRDDALKLKITAPPVEGQANEECIRFLADRLGVSKSRVHITGGHKSKKKTICVAGITGKDIEAIIPAG
ncbi:MAG: YggU family protein [Deltaproteobacteria bacterium]|nr:YggU family protein [Deltaproteobacteria bacterium]